MERLSHVDTDGKAKMVNVGGKEITQRSATATITVRLNADTYQVARENRSAKGDILAAAKLAGIQAAKKTSELIPLCHQIPLDQVDIQFDFDDESHSVVIQSTARCWARTGVEMEALTACSVAALTVYDMLKASQKDIVVTNLALLEKKGGKSGDFTRSDL